MHTPLPAQWLQIIVRNVALYRRIPEELKPELHGHIHNFLSEKYFEGCGGLSLTLEMKVTVAAIASILLLKRKSTYFPKCDSILIYPTAYIAEQQSSMGAIVVNKKTVRLGESWTRGVVVLAWDNVLANARDKESRHNVVLHEFAHQLDQEGGASNGTPILGKNEDYAEWARVMSEEYLKLRTKALHHMHDVLDSYGATNEAEFFAVATETFFQRPTDMKFKHPALYKELCEYYRLDPVTWKSGSDISTSHVSDSGDSIN